MVISHFFCVFVQAELPENWTDTKETLLEGMVFNVKYLGMTLVGQPKGEEMASAAIRRIVSTVSHRRPSDSCGHAHYTLFA